MYIHTTPIVIYMASKYRNHCLYARTPGAFSCALFLFKKNAISPQFIKVTKIDPILYHNATPLAFWHAVPLSSFPCKGKIDPIITTIIGFMGSTLSIGSGIKPL